MESREQFEQKKYKCENASVEEMLAESKNRMDPFAIAQLMVALKEERERTSAMIATLIRKVESLEMKIEKLERGESRVRGRNLLGEVDSELLKFVKRKGKVTADEVQRRFKYKGKNGASSRLHKLFSMGYLEKVQAGRKVYYLAK